MKKYNILNMVKFQIMSDIHIENLEDDLKIEDFIQPSTEILILAGDIGRVTKYKQLENFLKKICPFFEIVLYVLGNHEYYRVDNIKPKTMDEIILDLNSIKNNIPNLYILNRNSVIIDNVCITGCTLWSHVNINIPSFIVRIPYINSTKYNYLFQRDLNYIENMISYCQKKSLKLLVVTHHSPTFTVGLKKENDKYKTLYYNNLDNLLCSTKVHTWVCGHTHKNFDIITSRGTRVVSNQKGKLKDKVYGFSLNKIIEV